MHFLAIFIRFLIALVIQYAQEVYRVIGRTISAERHAMSKQIEEIANKISTIKQDQKEAKRSKKKALEDAKAKRAEIDANMRATKDPAEYTGLIKEKAENDNLIDFLERESRRKQEPAVDKETYFALKAELEKELQELKADRAPAIEQAVMQAVMLMHSYTNEALEIDTLTGELSSLHNPILGRYTSMNIYDFSGASDNKENWLTAFVTAYSNNVQDQLSRRR